MPIRPRIQRTADEIGADYATIWVINPVNDAAYNNPSFGMQLTGSSTAVRGWWVPLRKVGATLRSLLIEAAANEWQVDPAGCRLQVGVVSHPDSGRCSAGSWTGWIRRRPWR